MNAQNPSPVSPDAVTQRPAPSHGEARPVQVTVYRWAGKWGPFKVKIPCGECALTQDVIKDTMQNELAGIPINLEVRDWLSQWWRPLRKGGWHAPIILVEGKIISQGEALNRGVLAQEIIKAHAGLTKLEGTRVFGKETCPHCQRAKRYLEEAGIAFTYHDVVRGPVALYEMLARVKPIVGPKTPITVPQIWIDGRYIGGASDLQTVLARSDIEANPERGQNSMTLKPHLV